MSCTVLCCHVFIFCLQAASNSSPGSLKVFQSLSLDISGFILYFNISSYLSLIKFVEQVQDKRRGRTKNTSTADELYVKVTSLRNCKESSKNPTRTREVLLALQLIHLLLTKASSESVSEEGWLSRSCFLRNEMGRKGWGMLSYTRTGPKICGNRSYRMMNQIFHSSHQQQVSIASVKHGEGPVMVWKSCQKWLNYEH